MSPTLLTIAGYGLPSYGILAALGIVAALAVAWRLGRRVGLDGDFILDAVFQAVLAGFVGARLGYLVVSWRETLVSPVSALLSSGGGVYLAGLLSGAAAVGLLCRKRGVPLAGAADVFAPALALGHVFGRIGCHLAGCCWGRVISSGRTSWGVCYPRIESAHGAVEGSWPFLDHVKRGWVGAGNEASLPVVPVQLLEAGFNLLLFGLLMAVWSRRRFSGQIFLIYVLFYAVGRFGFEFLRGDADRGLYGPFSTSQWICLLLLAGGGAGLWRAVRAQCGTGEVLPAESRG